MTEENKDEKTTKTSNNNKWRYTTIALMAIVVLLIAAFLWKPGETSATGRMLTLTESNDIANKTVDFLNKNIVSSGTQATLESVSEASGILNITVLYQGRKIPIYTTADGKFLILSSPIDTTVPIEQPEEQPEQPTETPKTDKPTAELYIFSYCPAGTAALDSFAKVGSLLKNVADVKVKFFSNMHGEHEKQQNIIQECIQNLNKDKYWDYAQQYVAKIYNVCGSTRDINCDKNESIKLMKSVGINSDDVINCVLQRGEQLYAQDQEDAQKLSLQYSPSVVINEVYIGNADRSPDGLKNLICNAFNTAPSECSQNLSTTGTAASGGCAT
jgi:hypothetical protein